MQAVNNIYTVKMPFLIFVEGVSDRAMLAEYIKATGLKKRLPPYQIMSSDSKDKFNLLWKNITRQSKFQEVTHLAIFRDADNSADRAFQSVQTQLRINDKIPDDAVPNIALEVKTASDSDLKVGVFIIPDGELEGALETLLLKSLSDDMRNHVEEYVANAEASIYPASLVDYKNSPKSQTYAYSALFEMENFRDTFRKHTWDWEHEAFTSLKIFLQSFE